MGYYVTHIGWGLHLWLMAVYYFNDIIFIWLCIWESSSIFVSMKSIMFNKFVMNEVKGHHLQLWCHPLLFCNFKNAAAAHHPAIQKGINELLAKGATEQCTGFAGFYFNKSVVPEHMG